MSGKCYNQIKTSLNLSRSTLLMTLVSCKETGQETIRGELRQRCGVEV